MTLIAHDIIEPVPIEGDSAAEILITNHGWQVIEACASQLPDAARERAHAGEELAQAKNEWKNGSTRGHDPREGQPQRVAREHAPPTLGPELIDRLGLLADQPEGVAEIALSALPYGSRVSLIEHGVIEPVTTEVATDRDDAVEIVITDYGRRLIGDYSKGREHDGNEDQQRREAEAELVRARERRDHKREANGNRRQPHGERLTPVEAAFLLEESAGTPMHVGHVARFEGPVPPFSEVCARIGAQLHLVPRARQKLAVTLGGLASWRWIDDPNFNIEHHVHRAALPRPGDSTQLDQLVATIFSHRLARTKPLWEAWIVEGLERGDFALICKLNYALIAGLSGVDVAEILYDLYRKPAGVGMEPDWIPNAEPSTASLAAISIGDAARAASSLPIRLAGAAARPRRTVPMLRETVETLVQIPWQTWKSRMWSSGALDSPMSAPIGADRRVAFVDATLSEVKAIKNTFGGTVDDVVLAIVAGALRRWMRSRDQDVDSLEVRVAISSSAGGTEEEKTSLAGQITQLVTPLPVHEADPIERLRYVQEAVGRIKNSKRVDKADVIAGIQDFASPAILGHVARLGFSSRRYDLLVGNVAGSPLPLYLLGRRMLTMHPLAFLAGEHALAIAVMSYDGGVYFGLLGDYDALEDIDTLAHGITEELAELMALAGAQPGDDRESGERRQEVDTALS